MSNRKDVQAMGEPSPGSGSNQIGRRVMQRCGFACLITLISSNPVGVVVIPDDNAKKSDGYQGASMQPIVPVTTLFGFPSNPCSVGGGERDSHREPSSMWVSHGLVGSGASPFFPIWNLCIDSWLSVRANALELSHNALPSATVSDMVAMGGFAISQNMAYVVA